MKILLPFKRFDGRLSLISSAWSHIVKNYNVTLKYQKSFYASRFQNNFPLLSEILVFISETYWNIPDKVYAKRNFRKKCNTTVIFLYILFNLPCGNTRNEYLYAIKQCIKLFWKIISISQRTIFRKYIFLIKNNSIQVQYKLWFFIKKISLKFNYIYLKYHQNVK